MSSRSDGERPTSSRPGIPPWWRGKSGPSTRAEQFDAEVADLTQALGVPERTVMSIMGWSSTAMAARYQHVTDPIRRAAAKQVDGLLWADQDDDEKADGEGE